MIGTFAWGHIGDVYGIKSTILIYTILDIIVKLFIFFVNSKPVFLIYYCLLGLLDKALVTIVGPGLVEMYGLEGGTELLPIKSTSVFFTYGLIPIAQLMTAKFVGPLRFLEILGLLNILGIIPSYLLYRNTE
jgi:MFS family permease